MSTLNPTSHRSGSQSRGSQHVSRGDGLSIESLVCFVVNNRTYGIDVDLVREVVTVGTIFPVPNAAPAIAGVFSLRGATVALVDTSLLLALEGGDQREIALIVVRNHQAVCGLTIDRVVGVTRFVQTNFIPADLEREPAQVVGFMPDERGGRLTVLDSTVILDALTRLRFR
jgi:chemotaxis signal transduction protein